MSLNKIPLQKDQQIATKKIGQLLEDCKSVTGGELSKHIKDLYEYLAADTTAMYLIFRSDSFADSIRQKALDIFSLKRESFLVANAETKRFIYALTGQRIE
jgi:hypothetical protein